MIFTKKYDENNCFFSVCVPQYNRTSFLLKAMTSFKRQTFKNFEICVSDGGSTDNRWTEIVDFLKASGMNYVYKRSESNLRYDENLRESIDLATGRYCFLMANDDELCDENVLLNLYSEIIKNKEPQVVIANYKEFISGKIIKRYKKSRVMGLGPIVAMSNFRTYSFVSGILFDRELCLKHRTTDFDGVEMYQMYLGTRIVAEGGVLFGSDIVAVVKDIQIENEEVDSYARRPKIKNCAIEPRPLPMNGIGRLVIKAVEPFVQPGRYDFAVRFVFSQIYIYTYPFWIFEYRKVQSWKYSLGICLAMKPSVIVDMHKVKVFTRIYLWLLYFTSSILGLLIPFSLFFWLKPVLYRFAKRGTN